MSPIVLILGYLLVLSLILTTFLWFRRKIQTVDEAEILKKTKNTKKKDKSKTEKKGKKGNTSNKKRNKPNQQVLRRRRNQEPVAAVNTDDDDEDIVEVDEGDLNSNGELTKSAEKRIKKQMKKQQKDDEKKAKDEAVTKKNEKQNAYREKIRQKNEQREIEERKQEEEEKRLEQEQLEKEQQEFDDWKNLFTIETKGTIKDDMLGETGGLLNDFVNFIKKNKVTPLEDLAIKFNLRTEDVVKRIKTLMSSGRITGVLDDRGKFIYITNEEMDAVAKFIHEKGRVTIYDIVNESNKLIVLEELDQPKDSTETGIDDDMEPTVEP